MPQTGQLGIKVSVDDSELKQLIESIAALASSMGGSTNQAMQSIMTAVKSTSAQVQTVVQDSGERIKAVQESVASKSIELNEKEATEFTKTREQEVTVAQTTSDKELAAQQALERGLKALEEESASTAKRYAELKAEYETKSVDAVREKIHEYEQDVRLQRKQTADTVKRLTEEGDAEAAKAIKAKAQLQINSTEKELQLYRSLEKEKVGRTFSEMMERLNLEEKSNREIKALMERQAEEFKEVQQKMTITQDAEEKKRLQMELNTLKSETAAVKKEAEERGIAEKKGEEKHEGGGGIMGVVREAGAIGAAVEGFKILREKAEEAHKANVDFKNGLAATGLQGEALKKEFEDQGKAAEGLGDKYAMSTEEVKTAMGQVAGMSGKSGKELQQLTEDAIVLAKSTGQSVEMVAKTLSKASDAEIEGNATKIGVALDKNMTAEQRAAKIHEAAMQRQKQVQESSNDAMGNAQRIMNKVMETVSELAGKILQALKPAIDAIIPIITILTNALNGSEESGGLVKDIMEALTPVITDVAQLLQSLAPIVIELVQSGLAILKPILGTISDLFKAVVPILTEVIQTVVTALSPVLKALMPVFQEIIGIVKEVFMAVFSAGVVPLLKDVFAPLLRDVVAPILLSLTPILKMIADLASALLIPAVKLLSGVLSFLVENAIKPVVSWIGGTLKKAVEAVVPVIEKVVGTITSIVNTVGGLLGITSKAAAQATKAAGAEVNKAAEESNAEAQEQQEKHDKAAEAAAKKAAAERAKAAKAAQSQQRKDTKSHLDAERQALDEALSDRKSEIETALAEGRMDDAEAKREELKAQQEHDQKMLDVLTKYHQKVAQAKAALAKDAAATRKNEHDQIVADNAREEESQIDAIESKVAKGAMSESEGAYEIAQIQKNALKERIAVEQTYGNDTLALERQLRKLEEGELKQRSKDHAAINKELLQHAAEAKKDRIALLKEEGKDAAAIRAAETKEAEDEENKRYQDELDARKDELNEQAYLDKGDVEGAKLIHQVKEALEQNHQNKLTAIRENARKQDEADYRAKLGSMLQIAQASNADRLKLAQDFAQKQLGIQDLSLLQEQGGLKKFLAQNLLMVLQNKIAEQMAYTSSEAAKTGATNAGFIARSATLLKDIALGAWAVAQKVGQTAAMVASDVASAAADAFKATVSGIKWVMDVVPFPVNLALIPPTIAAVYGLYTGARKLFKFAEGAMLTGPTDFTFAGGKQGWSAGQAGEAGHEAIIPLNRYPGMKHLMDGGFEAAMQPVVHKLSELHQATVQVHEAVKVGPPPIVVDSYRQQLSINQAVYIQNRRKL